MNDADRLIHAAGVHEQWRPVLRDALSAVDADYLNTLLQDETWLPGPAQLLAAFRRDRLGLRYLLIGESPYPRRESANGIAFYDAAVTELWSEQGLSKAVNRATSMRNLLKTALLAEGLLAQDETGKIPQPRIAATDKTKLIRTMAELFDNLHGAGLLMLNATPVLHPDRKPAQEARFWQGFLDRLLAAIAAAAPQPPTLVLWGKIAQVVEAAPASNAFPKLVAEHPYNVSFIDNPDMQRLFAELAILQRR